MTVQQGLLIAARGMLATLFLAGFVQKAVDPVPVREMLAGAGLPGWTLWPVALFDLVAGLALAAGWRVTVWSLALAAYCLCTIWFHWVLRADPWQVTIMVKNFAIAGGCLALAATGLERRG